MTTQEISDAIADPRTYRDPAIMYGLFDRLRRDEPVRWTEPEGYRPFWAITRHADIMEVEKQPLVFTSAPRTALRTIAQEENIRKATGGSAQVVRTLIQMDPPDHGLYRKLTQAWFMPGKLRALEPAMKQLAAEFIDRMEARNGACDFVDDVALWYPLRAILRILGVPESDEEMILRLTQQHFAGTDPSVQREAGEADASSAAQQLFAYFNQITADRRKNPRNDLFSLLADAEVDGRPISDFDRNSYYFIVAVAGHDTTSSSISGFLKALIDHPDQFRKLKKNPALMDTAIEEAIRWTSPVFHFFRTAAEDYELRGQKIRKGDALMLIYPAANRDETVFEAPNSFRVDRKPNPHVAFGYGPHLCLGQHFAKLELRMFFGQLLPRLREVRMAGDAAWLETNFVGGLKALPISYRLDAPAFV